MLSSVGQVRRSGREKEAVRCRREKQVTCVLSSHLEGTAPYRRPAAAGYDTWPACCSSRGDVKGREGRDHDALVINDFQ